jgi:hypothetical protein
MLQVAILEVDVASARSKCFSCFRTYVVFKCFFHGIVLYYSARGKRTGHAAREEPADGALGAGGW